MYSTMCIRGTQKLPLVGKHGEVVVFWPSVLVINQWPVGINTQYPSGTRKADKEA